MRNNCNDVAEELNQLGKEFWGILSFELNLNQLYTLLNGREMGIGFNRLSDWILFPHKIPADHRVKIESILENRFENQIYKTILEDGSVSSDEESHKLLIELLRLKYSNGESNPAHFHKLYNIPLQMFVAILSQMVEESLITSRKLMELFTEYKERMNNPSDEELKE